MPAAASLPAGPSCQRHHDPQHQRQDPPVTALARRACHRQIARRRGLRLSRQHDGNCRFCRFGCLWRFARNRRGDDFCCTQGRRLNCHRDGLCDGQDRRRG